MATTMKDDSNKTSVIYLSLNEEQLLAEQVQKHPILYNKYTKGHLRDKDVLKNEAWAEVADALHFVTDSTQAQKLFFVLKKKFLRKRREVKEAYRGGSAINISKAEKAYHQYEFLAWLSEYLQEREARKCNTSYSNTWSNGGEKKEMSSDQEEGNNLFSDMDDIPTMVPKRSLATPSSEISSNSVMIDTKHEDHQSEPYKPYSRNSSNQHKHETISPTDSYKHFQISESREMTQKRVHNNAASPIDSFNHRSQTETGNPELLVSPSSSSTYPSSQKMHSPGIKRKSFTIDSLQHDKDEIFCKGLVLDLKELPLYERLHAKQEMRNVLFKYQIAAMEKQQQKQEQR